MKVRLPDKGSVRVADIDGSFLIGHQFSCLMIRGDIDILLEAEPIKKEAKSYPAARDCLPAR